MYDTVWAKTLIRNVQIVMPNDHSAVIFDLGGTLTPALSWSVQQETLGRMAHALGLSPTLFIPAWARTFEDRMKGTIGSSRENIERVCRDLGAQIEEDQLEAAASMEIEQLSKIILNPRKESASVLRTLKSKGIRTGLLSDCSSEVPVLWERSGLAPLIDFAVFSCLTGTKKPDPRLFEMAAGGLKVKADGCLYVADGIGTELSGASSIGMTSLMLRTQGENDLDPYREAWPGPVIDSLFQVVDFVLPPSREPRS